jgi:type IV pilus assembly protein PilW
MVREIRLAGMDKTGTAGAGFDIAGPHSIRFTLDFRGDLPVLPGVPPTPDGDVLDEGEDISYRFLAAVDTNADGIADAGATQLKRSVYDYNIVPNDFTDDTLAEDIHAIGFAYAFDDDGDGELDYVDGNGNGVLDAGEEYWAYDSDADGDLDWDNYTDAALALPSGTHVNFDKIRAVRVWILARTRNPLRGYSGLKDFTVGNKVIKPNDNFKYRLLTHTVKCRNMGL